MNDGAVVFDELNKNPRIVILGSADVLGAIESCPRVAELTDSIIAATVSYLTYESLMRRVSIVESGRRTDGLARPQIKVLLASLQLSLDLEKTRAIVVVEKDDPLKFKEMLSSTKVVARTLGRMAFADSDSVFVLPSSTCDSLNTLWKEQERPKMIKRDNKKKTKREWKNVKNPNPKGRNYHR